jgi:hypothetical protein
MLTNSIFEAKCGTVCISRLLFMFQEASPTLKVSEQGNVNKGKLLTCKELPNNDEDKAKER